jgi:pimeloyl-ACP methyl ester carboxylesterase
MAGSGGSVIYPEGPWSHRPVTANGTRFHIAESGDGPLVLLLHGFPQFWWAWRQQLASLPAAGFRAVAPDLRGYGGSDKPPRGYDLVTAASDVAGLIRALGEANAVVVGHDWGGLVAWTMATYFPKVVRRLAVVSAPHPLLMRGVMLSAPLRQGWLGWHLLGFQLPVLPERWLTRDGGAQAGRLLAAWAGPGWPDAATRQQYQAAICVPSAAHSALEYYRWFLRSPLRPDGIRFAQRMRFPVQVPTLHLHGALDRCVPPGHARGSARYVEGPYRWRLIDGAGHFPAEEQPARFDAALHDWLADPEPEQ